MAATPLTMKTAAVQDEFASPRSNALARLHVEYFRNLVRNPIAFYIFLVFIFLPFYLKPQYPSARLVAFFDASTPNPEQAIAKRLNEVVDWLGKETPSKAHIWSLVPRTYYQYNPAP